MLIQFTSLLFTAIFTYNSVIVNAQSFEIDQRCIDCVCKATGTCHYPSFCSNVGSGYYCGPLQISWAYWADGGKLGDFGNKHDFEDCLTTKECAENTMRNYMRKYAQDCNNDGVIDCLDFAILHKTGFRSCKQSAIENTKYWKDFTLTQCFRSGNENRFRGPTNSINPNNQPGIVRNVFTHSSSSSTTIRNNVRRTITNNDNNHNSLNERSFNNRFKEDLIQPNRLIAFDNFNHHNGHLNNLNNPNNGANFNELTIETNRLSSRPSARINVLNRNSNNFNPIHRKPDGNLLVKPPPPARDSTRESNQPIRVISVNGNVQPRRSEPVNNLNSFSNNNLKLLSNATITIDNKCLNCLCYGSTKCNLKMKCSGSFCGSFLLSWQYWKEGGSLLGDYVKCANDFNCAKQTVANYIARHNKDCDLNNELTCDDFALMHQSGGYECVKNAEQIKKSLYWINYSKCYYDDNFRVFSNNEESITGYSIVSSSVKPDQPPAITENFNNNNQLVPRNAPPRSNVPTINLTNDWKPIEPIINRNNNNNQPPVNNRPPINNNNVIARPDHRPTNNINNFRPIAPNPPPNNNDNNVQNRLANTNNEDNNEDNRNNGPINSQPANRLTRKPINLVRPPPRAFENNNENNNNNNENDEEISEQPNAEAPNNFNSYDSNNNNNDQTEPEIVPVENNHRRTSPRSPSLITSNVIPVEPNSPVTTSLNRKNNITVSDSCLDCICTSISENSNCMDRSNCYINSYGEKVCGPYNLNRFFWTEAGKPQDNGEADSFEQCASDRICSQRTIKAYVNKYSIDCNDDQEINCMDFAAIVRTGKACSLQNLIDSNYWSKFQACYGFEND